MDDNIDKRANLFACLCLALVAMLSVAGLPVISSVVAPAYAEEHENSNSNDNDNSNSSTRGYCNCLDDSNANSNQNSNESGRACTCADGSFGVWVNGLGAEGSPGPLREFFGQ